jgi:imidazolonepropionase-like amidohydrolase
VIDGINGVRKNQTVIFEDDKIIAVQAADLATPVSKYLDGNEKFLIPGLWDFHIHLTYDEAFTDSMPALFLYYGITSVRDTGGLMQKMLPLVKKLRSKTAISPRAFFQAHY